MGEVYGNAYLHIAGLGGATSRDGLIKPRNPLHLLPCNILPFIQEIKWPNILSLTSATIKIQDGTPESSPIRRTLSERGYQDYREAMIQQPLNKRAWVLQERALSRRTLYFGAKGLFWDCIEKEIDEYSEFDTCSPTLLPGALKPGWEEANVNRLLWNANQKESALNNWYLLLNQYSQSNLTNESDRLVAISSVANRISTTTGLTYAAGLWEEEMPRDLLWCAVQPVKVIKSTLPSWSWASLPVGAGLRWPYLEHVQAADVHKIIYKARVSKVNVDMVELPTYHPSSGRESSLGSIRGGSIKVYGMCYKNLVTFQGISVIDNEEAASDLQRPSHWHLTLLSVTLSDGTSCDFGLIVISAYHFNDPSAAKRVGIFYGLHPNAEGSENIVQLS